MALVYIASKTASADATLSFTSGIDATYNEYQFHFVNMHPATDNVDFEFQVNAAGASGFNEPMITTAFGANHQEGDGYAALGYQADHDQATAGANNGLYQPIIGYSQGNGNDESLSGVLTLYNPSSTTYVKHFTSRGSAYHYPNAADDSFMAGYINTTAAIDEISFAFESGNIDAGTIHMYGVG